MQLTYTHRPEYQFPHWIEFETTQQREDFNKTMDINEWVGNLLGDLGVEWGYERRSDSSSAPAGLNPAKVRLFYTKIIFSWRFKKKEDAMLFKLTWGGA